MLSYLSKLVPIVIGGAIFLTATNSWGLSAADVAKIAKEATVKIEGESSQGSGEIIGRQGNQYLVLTAAHVVKVDQVKYELVTSDDRRYPVKSDTIQILPGVDLAVIRFTSDRSYPVPKLGNANNSTEGTTIYVSGFPTNTEAINQSIFNFTDGKVTANSSRPLKDGYSIIYSNNTLPGMSGGGVFNDQGELVAIHGKGDVDTQIQVSTINPSIRIKTGFNLGIPINTFQKLAAKIGVAINNMPIATNSTQPRADNFMVSGFDRVSKNDLAGSVVEFTKALALNPKHITARFWRGSCLLLMGNARAAIADLSQTIALNPRKVEAYIYRGSAYAQIGERTKAIVDLDRAVSLQPKSDLAYGSRCSLKYQFGDFFGAIEDCNRAIQLKPRKYLYYSDRGQAKYRVQDLPGAITDFTASLRLNPANAEIYSLRGNTHAAIGDFRSALTDYDRSISLDRHVPTVYYQRGLLKVKLGNKPGAIADLQAAAKLYLEQNNQSKYQLTLQEIDKLERSGN